MFGFVKKAAKAVGKVVKTAVKYSFVLGGPAAVGTYLAAKANEALVKQGVKLLPDKVEKPLHGLVAEGKNLFKEALSLNKGLWLLEAPLSLLGIRPVKRLRIRVVVLRDPDSNLPLLADAEIAGGLLPAIDLARQVFFEKANVKIVDADPVLVTTPVLPAPEPALMARCGSGAQSEDLGISGEYYRSLARPGDTFLGAGGALTVIIVRDFAGQFAGCSLSALADYVTVAVRAVSTLDDHGLPRSTVAHEIGHACNLNHSNDGDNLMKKSSPRGATLKAWQVAIARNSRRVTYL